MATKTATKKSSTARKKTTVSKAASGKIVHSLEDAKNLDSKTQARRFGVLYIVFACTTLALACVSVKLYLLASDIESKYEAIEVCVRTGKSCEIKKSTVVEDSEVEIAPEEEIAE